MRFASVIAGALIGSALLAGCGAKSTEPKPVVPSGSFTAKINGNRWEGAVTQDGTVAVETWALGGSSVTASASAARANGGFSTMDFEFNGPLALGAVHLGDITHGSKGFAHYVEITPNSPSNPNWMTDSTHTGILTVTALDRQNGGFHATFAFTAYDADHGTTLTVTEGVLDGHFNIISGSAPLRAMGHSWVTNSGS